MEKPSIFNGYLSKHLAGASLVALLSAAPVWAADAPPSKGKSATDGADQNRAQPMPPEIKTQLKSIEEKLDALKPPPKPDNHIYFKDTMFEFHLPGKITHDDVKDWFENFLIALSFASSLAAFFSIRQARRYKDEQEAGVKKQEAMLEALNASMKRLHVSTKKTERATGAANYLIKQNSDNQTAKSQANNTQDTLNRDANIDRAERVGSFPDMYNYISERIQNAKETVVITMPFYKFGILGYPQGLQNFHHTLCERFDNATVGSDKPHLTFITYDDASRYAMARKRYSRAIHAIDMLDDTPQAKKLESFFNKDIGSEFLQHLRFFRKTLDEQEDNLEILTKLGEEQTNWLEKARTPAGERNFSAKISKFAKIYNHTRAISDREASDIMFIRWLAKDGRELDKKLFFALHEARDAFSEAVEAQERIYFNRKRPWDGTGTPWPEGATIVKVPRGELEKIKKTFDNEMTIFIDGIEVIRAYSSLDPRDTSRKNRLASESGPMWVKKHKDFLSSLFEAADRSQLKEKDLKRLFDILPDSEMVLDWLTSPEPKS